MQIIFRSALIFAVAYVIFMVPSYVLPWLGSNSAVLYAAGAVVGHGAAPLWWLHAWCLGMLVVLTWVRGDLIGTKYLPVFPFLAAVFDLTPGLSLIPFAPTVFHLVAIIAGVKGAVQQPTTEFPAAHGRWKTARKAAGVAIILTLVAIFGSIQSVTASHDSLRTLADGNAPSIKPKEEGQTSHPEGTPGGSHHAQVASTSNSAKAMAGRPTLSNDAGNATSHAQSTQGTTLQLINLND